MISNLLNETTDINTSKYDENFLKNFLKDFYHKIIETKDFNNFEKILSEWIRNYLKNNDNKIIKLMENHKESKFLFKRLVGFFYQLSIGCDLDKEYALVFYLLLFINIII